MNATPTQLGNITLGRALVQALSSPIGGFAGKSPQCCSRYSMKKGNTNLLKR